MKDVPIGVLVEPVSKWNPRKEAKAEFEYVDLSAVDNISKTITGSATVTGANAPSRARQLIREGDLLVSTVRPNLNSVAAVPQSMDGATASTGFTVLRPGLGLDGRYLFHWLQSQTFIENMVRRATGASYPAISDQTVKSSPIPLPTIDEQRRIAAILDHADALRTKRRQALAHLDSLTQSIFHEMFATASLPQRPLNELAQVSSGITKGRRTKEPTKTVPYLAVANVQAGHLKLDAVKDIEATKTEIERYQLMHGDLVLTEGGDPDKLGRGTVWRDELPICIHQNHIFRVRPGNEVLPDYLAMALQSRSSRSYFLRAAKQTTGIASINMTQLKAVQIPVPTLEEQEKFVTRVASISESRQQRIEHINVGDQLFSSLQSRAFRGEL